MKYRAVSIAAYQFPLEVGPSAAGQCLLPDFGGKELSQGDSMEKMKLSKIICVAYYIIWTDFNFLLYFPIIIKNNMCY